jgi:DNA-binding NtrC family response regulator
MTSMIKQTVLMVDDEKAILDSLTNQLRSVFAREYRYETATNFDEAWEVIEDTLANGGSFRMIISDWLLGQAQDRGDDFLIAVHRKYPDIPKVMLSGYADPDSVARAYTEANLLAYLTKPWQPDQITYVIRELQAPQTALKPF